MSARTKDLVRLSAHWMCDLPQAFARLHAAFDYPYVQPCEFIPLGELLTDSERWRGMLPQFLPFGFDEDENVFGFLMRAGSHQGEPAVLYWDHEYDHYRPVASSFEAFLRWCLIRGRYEAHDEQGDDDPLFSEAEEQRRDFSKIVGIADELAEMPVPRNATEMHEQSCSADPQATDALNQLGCRHLGQGNYERARDFFARASESAPWFADPYYLIGETYAQMGLPGEAVQRFRRVLDCPIALSTRTGLYDLGAGRDDAEISEEAGRACLSYGGSLDTDPLLRFLNARSDAFEPLARLEVALEFERAADDASAEREYLNAVTLATEPREMEHAYLALIRLYERTGRDRDAEWCRRDAGRAE